MDIRQKAEELVNKIKNDSEIKTKFEKDSGKTVEELLGVDLPDDTVKQVTEAVKAKLNFGNVGDMASKLGGLFGKK